MFVVFLSSVALDIGLNLLKKQTEYHEKIENKMEQFNFAVRPYLASEKPEILAEFIDVMSPEADFTQISIQFLDSKVTVSKTFTEYQYLAPQWLATLDLFPSLKKQTALSQGWKEIAEITFISNPNKSYDAFLSETTKFVWSLFVLLLITYVLLASTFKSILNPINKLTRKARDITFNRFTGELPLPKEVDLQLITKAMNQMSLKLKNNFDQQASEAYRIRENAFRDVISGLGNRNYFNNQVTSWLSEGAIGSLVLIKHHKIMHALSQNNLESSDLLAKSFADKLSTIAVRGAFSIYRINPDEFAIMTSSISVEELKMLGNNLFSLANDDSETTQNDIVIGITINNGQIREKSILMTQADSALRDAINSTERFVILDQLSQTEGMGKQQWKSLILDAIAHDWIKFKYQSASDQESRIIHQEVFSAIESGNKYYSAGRFLAAVEQLEMGELFDCHVINRMIERLTHEPKLGPLTINLTIQSVTSPSFIRWLATQLQKNSNLSGRLFFEIPENAFISFPDHLSLVTEQISRYKFGFGIDNYGRNFKSLGYLSHFTPTYVKIDYSYTNSLGNDEQNYVLSSICRTAHNLNITTIATRVETEDQLNKLSELFVNGFQGFIFEKKKNVSTLNKTSA